MKLTKNSVESALRDYSPRTKVGDNTNPLRRVFTRLGVTVDLNSPKTPAWLRNFVLQAQARNTKSISARAALTLLSTI
jgi:CBS-domain-containing membrane protein